MKSGAKVTGLVLAATATLTIGLVGTAAAVTPPKMDGRIAEHKTGPFVGAKLRNHTGVDQTVSKSIAAGEIRKFYYKAKNLGPGTGAYAVRGTGDTACFDVHYYSEFVGGADFTAGITGSGVGDPGIPVGQVVKYRIKIEALPCAGPGDKVKVKVDGGTIPESENFDRVRAKVHV